MRLIIWQEQFLDQQSIQSSPAAWCGLQAQFHHVQISIDIANLWQAHQYNLIFAMQNVDAATSCQSANSNPSNGSSAGQATGPSVHPDVQASIQNSLGSPAHVWPIVAAALGGAFAVLLV